MARYDYRCPNCTALFEAYGTVNDRFVSCANCGSEAERRPFSGIPYLKGETVARQIPETAYKQERQKKDLAGQGWTAERSVELIRKNTHTDPEGQRQLDVGAMNRAGAK